MLARGFLDAVPTRLEALYVQTFWNVAVADSALFFLPPKGEMLHVVIHKTEACIINDNCYFLTALLLPREGIICGV